MDVEYEGVPFNQVPDVAGELPFDVRDEAWRSEEANRVTTTEDDPQKMIEANKVIDVGVRNKDIGNLQQIGRRLRRQITEIQQKGASFPPEPHKEAGIIEYPIEEP